MIKYKYENKNCRIMKTLNFTSRTRLLISRTKLPRVILLNS